MNKNQQINTDKKGYLNVEGRLVPKKSGVNGKLENGKVYKIGMHEQLRELYLEETDPIKLPEKLVNTEQDLAYMKRIITTFDKTTRPNIGIMFHGIKGGGKTVSMEQVAVMSGRPIIRMNPDFNYQSQANLLAAHDEGEGLVLLFDEFEKYFGVDQGLLSFLDGDMCRFKKMCILTANQIGKIDDNLFSRPGRIMFIKAYQKSMESHMIKSLISSAGYKDAEVNELYAFMSQNFKLVTTDIVLSFLSMLEIFPPENDKMQHMLQLAGEMNIELKEDRRFHDISVTGGIKKDTKIQELLRIAQKNNPEKTNKDILEAIYGAIDMPKKYEFNLDGDEYED